MRKIALNQRLADLQSQLKNRQEAPKPEQSVLVRPGGVGSRAATNLFFVECNSTGIVMHERNAKSITVLTYAIPTSEDYRRFLARTKNLAQEEIAKLEAMLDTTPVLEASSPEEVNIPNNRPIPSNAQIFYALVFGDRVHLIDPFTPVELFQAEFNKRRRDFRIERVAQQGADTYIHDQQKIVEHFGKFDFRAPGGQTISVLPNPYGNRLPLQIVPDPVKGGTSLEELRKPGSEFEKALRSTSNKRRAVVMFWVSPESFNTYLLARKVTGKARCPPAGRSIRVRFTSLCCRNSL